ncbi:MAG: rod shape-determining protein MreD [Syntrophorhabdus sp. PtaU1.Bin058]|nr:MAG: rod shape-determining protein MreD [Syntrophorhabdus sp. PtaU1.Bin058]
MKIAVYTFIGLLLLLVESSLLSFIPLEIFKPDLGIPFIIYTSLFLGPQAGIIATLFIGFMQEGLSAAPHGSILFVNIAIFLITIFLKRKLYIDSKYSFAFVCSGFVVLESFLFITLSLLARGEADNVLNILFYTIPNAVFTGFIAIFIFSFIEYLNVRYLERE